MLARMTASDPASTHSVFYEQLVEHVFISELLQEAWFGFGERVEVLHGEIDASGYDVVLECRGILRHVQLKTSRKRSTTARQKVHVDLASKPSGCVIWIQRDEGGESNRVELRYRFFGGKPGKPLPSLAGLKVAKHTKGDSSGRKKERPQIRVLPKGKFTDLLDMPGLLECLFGLKA